MPNQRAFQQTSTSSCAGLRPRRAGCRAAGRAGRPVSLPDSPLATVTSNSLDLKRPMGVMMAAVPQANTSVTSPDLMSSSRSVELDHRLDHVDGRGILHELDQGSGGSRPAGCCRSGTGSPRGRPCARPSCSCHRAPQGRSWWRRPTKHTPARSRCRCRCIRRAARRRSCRRTWRSRCRRGQCGTTCLPPRCSPA